MVAVVSSLALFAGPMALADEIIADGEGVEPIAARSLDFGEVCLDTVTSKPVVLAAMRTQQQPANQWLDGATVTVSIVNATPSSVVATGDGTLVLESNWRSLPEGTVSANRVEVSVALSATTLGPVSGSVTFLAAGLRQGSQTLTRNTTMPVTATVVTCDTTPPTLALPGPIVAEATGAAGAVVTFTATATDENPTNPAVTCTPTSGSTFPLGTTTVECSATDAAGNTATGSFPVTVEDTTAPAIQDMPTDVTVSALDADGAIVTYDAPTATDLVDGDVAVGCDPASGVQFALGSTTVTCTASDAAGNVVSESFSVTIVDDTAPILTLVGATAEATGPDGAVVEYVASAVDAVDGPITPSCDRASGSLFPLGDTTVECSATDEAGNVASGSLTVSVVDTTAPDVTVPDSAVVEAEGPDGAEYSFVAGATDIVSGTLTPSCTPPSGNTFPLGTTTVTCSATDGAGNTGSAAFTVTVEDSTPPHLTLPADVLLEATGPGGAAHTFAASAFDLVDGNLFPTCDAASGATFPLGTTTVTCSVVDAAGNQAMGSFTIEVKDTTAPDLEVPDDVTLEATGPDGAVAEFIAVATDVVDPAVNLVCTPPSGSTFALGTTVVECSATDASGNEATDSFQITVQDTTPPVISGSLEDLTVEATGSDGAEVTFTPPTAYDLVDEDTEVTCEPVSGSTFGLGTTTVVCSASDAAGNYAEAKFDVTIEDTTGPTLVLPSPVAEASGPDGASVDYEASATDLVDGNVEATCAPPSGSLFPLGTTQVDCFATDSAENTTEDSFVVTVVDTTPPALEGPESITAEATGPDGATVTFVVSAFDLVDGAVTPVCDRPSGSTFALGTVTVTCSATDARGNTDEVTFTVTVEDTTAPDVTAPDDIVGIEATSGAGATVTFIATASDLVDGDLTVTCSPASGSTFALGTTTVDCEATDAAGNIGSAAFTVQVVDTTAPALTLPDDLIAEATGPSGAPVGWSASANDVVDGAVGVTCEPPSGTTFEFGDTTVECSATDAAGNTATGTFQVTVEDTTGPEISGTPTNLTVEATGATGAVVTYTPPTAVDLVNGTVPVTCEPPSGSTFPLGLSDVTCSAADATGNASSTTFSIDVQDTTAPVLALPAGVVAEATGPDGAVVSFATTADDLVDGDVPVTCEPESGSTFALDSTTVDCAATDSASNTASGSFDVTVQDTTAPTLSLPTMITAEATSASGAEVAFVATAEDLVDGNVGVTCLPASGTTFGLGSTTVNCSATDTAGNTAEGSFDVTVRDTTAPVLDLPDDITAEATGPSGAAVSFTATAQDLVDGAVAVECMPGSGSTFVLGTTTVNCSATDVAGNGVGGSFTVTVQDTTAPTVTAPAAVVTGPTNDLGAIVHYGTATASDLVDGDVPVVCTPASGTQFSFGETTVTCSATDAAGNTGTATTTVTVGQFTTDGFGAPIGKGKTNAVKGGSTVPLKWELFGADGLEFTSVGTVRSGFPKAVQYHCQSGADLSEIADPATGGTSLRYDGKDGQFVYNWQTPKKPGTCWRLDIGLQDGQTLSVEFLLR